VLKERHLISHELAEKSKGSALIVSGDERMAIMINEEDHLRMQFIDAGMDVVSGWSNLDALDSRVERFVEYAFDKRIGYLTACPSNVGTGLRASVMMHLAGLKLVNEIDAVIKGLARIGLMVRGILGEGSEARGNMFQICSQTTMGETEEQIIERVSKIAGEVAGHELNARARLMEKSSRFVMDQIVRALALLQNARLMTSGEALDLLSGLRFGVERGIIKNFGIDRVGEITLLTQPGHLQKLAGRKLSASDRDEIRADMLRERLKDVIVSE
jgi:protein arginine kinase